MSEHDLEAEFDEFEAQEMRGDSTFEPRPEDVPAEAVDGA